jgi:hypothetical protein
MKTSRQGSLFSEATRRIDSSAESPNADAVCEWGQSEFNQ